MRENIEWLIEQYTDEIEKVKRDARFGLTYESGRISAFSRVVNDLQSILDESEDE